MKFLVECLNTYNNCLSRVTIKVLAVTVRLQNFVTVQNKYIHCGTMELLKVLVLVSAIVHFTTVLSIEGMENGTYID